MDPRRVTAACHSSPVNSTIPPFPFLWVFGLALVVWIIYLRYLLARKTIESRTELDKCRLQLEYAHQSDSPPLLECPPSAEPPTLAEGRGAAD